MPEQPPPFITAAEIAQWWRPLTESERTLADEILIPAASRQIRRRIPTIGDDDPDARLVVFQVVRSVLLPGQYAGFSSWSETVGGKTTAIAAANPAADLVFLPQHWEALGLSNVPSPRGHFPRDDY